MVHVLLPYAVLPIYAALVRIDPALLRASEGLGASAVTTFRRVLLPLSLSGVATAATFTFLLALGFFVTPALLGGASSITLSMLIDGFVSDRLDWPLAAAASVLLLVAALAFVGRSPAASSPIAQPSRGSHSMIGRGCAQRASSRWSRRSSCCRSSRSSPRRSARRASSACRRKPGRCAGGARSSTTVVAAHAAREPEGGGAARRDSVSPEPRRRSASRGAARAAARC